MFTRPERIREEKSDRRLCTANGSAGPKKYGRGETRRKMCFLNKAFLAFIIISLCEMEFVKSKKRKTAGAWNG